MSRRGDEIDRIPPALSEAILDAFVDPPDAESRAGHLAMISTAAEEMRRGVAGASEPSSKPLRARITAAAVLVLAVPSSFAALAFAGVEAPGAIDSAFESVGIDLPNQAPDAEEPSSASEVEGIKPASKAKGAGGKGKGSEDDAGKAGGNAGGDGKGKPDHAQGGGSNGPPAHAQDGVTGAPDHSNQGGQGNGTPPPHAQDGQGGPPAFAPGASPPGASQTTSPPNSGSGPASANPDGAPPQADPKD